MPRMSPLKGLLVVVLMAVLAPPAFAQSQAAGGAIQGTVTDESGAVLPGVAVTVRNLGTGVVRETRTDPVGLFRAPLLPVGAYEVTAALAGFATTKRPSLVLNIGSVLSIDIALKVAATQEEVTVTAEAPVIETARTQQSSIVNERAVSNLPVNGRNFIDFVLTTPGVTRDTRAGDISFAGQRGTLNSLVIDGADNNNTFFGQTLGRTGSGRAPYQFSQDAVQEFQVNSNAYSAEYGRAGGAVINVVTKRPKSPYHYNQFGASFGGPLKKDRHFVFANYDGQRNTQPNDVFVNVPGGTALDATGSAGLARLTALGQSYGRTQDQNVLLVKTDSQLSRAHRLTLRYNHQNFTGNNFENGGPQNAIEHTGASNVRTRTINAAITSVFSNAFLNEARFQWAKDGEPGF